MTYFETIRAAITLSKKLDGVLFILPVKNGYEIANHLDLKTFYYSPKPVLTVECGHIIKNGNKYDR